MVVLFRQRVGNDIVEGRRVGTPLFGPPGIVTTPIPYRYGHRAVVLQGFADQSPPDGSPGFALPLLRGLRGHAPAGAGREDHAHAPIPPPEYVAHGAPS